MILFVVSVFCLLLIFAVRYSSPFYAFLLIVATKSIVDATWQTRVGPFSLTSVEGIILVILYVSAYRTNAVSKEWRKLGFLLFFLLSFSLVFSFFTEPMSVLESLVLNLNILLGFFLVPMLVNSREKFRKFLIAILVAGIFPIAVSIYQKYTGFSWSERSTAGLARMVGVYHDAFPVRFYGEFTLLAGLMYLRFFAVRRIYQKWLIYILMLGAIFSIYHIFSKAAVAILVSWSMILIIFSKNRIRFSLLLLSFAVIAPFLLGDSIEQNILQLFSREIQVREGVLDSRYALAGRGTIWEAYWDFWLHDQHAFFQIFGDGISRPAHNEYFRILLLSGVFGLCLYVVFLFRVVSVVLSSNKNFKPYVLMLLAMYLVDAIGLTPGEYYFYNILTWGFVGLMYRNDSAFSRSMFQTPYGTSTKRY
ncbi:hypothetical protein EY643_02520 [Halioglobus maricola]|uniref:O-antigen ligase domain-containing protein n=1 Tax=Halioglobus maricola TaxID=2601894 RepID=A0A5P9NFQ6_9GAMM|nr:hypothetical protein [Halioglobus maricola]QFU74617.1 hypothetical protein EY643_02520 [Halioglobus maricola]